MEGLSVFERTKDQLDRLRKSVTSNTITIDMMDMDSETRGVFIDAINKAIDKRYNDVINVITGANKV